MIFGHESVEGFGALLTYCAVAGFACSRFPAFPLLLPASPGVGSVLRPSVPGLSGMAKFAASRMLFTTKLSFL